MYLSGIGKQARHIRGDNQRHKLGERYQNTFSPEILSFRENLIKQIRFYQINALNYKLDHFTSDKQIRL